jgi:ribosome-binding ATPase YchF (GTP1/OBG family)
MLVALLAFMTWASRHYSALTAQSSALAANYPFATIELTLVSFRFPMNVWTLARLVKTMSSYHAVEFLDIAGLVRGASKGEGLVTVLANIREPTVVLLLLFRMKVYSRGRRIHHAISKRFKLNWH